MNIYEKIKKKKGLISALAPMEGVTDSVFRQIVSDLGKPDLFFTEFLNVEGYCSKGMDRVVHRVEFSKKERPLVIQLWGNQPEYYVETINSLKKLKPDGIDINMGCSVRDVLSGGRGSGLIQDKELAGEIIDAVKSVAGKIPVSVKTRLGYDRIDVEGWIGFLLKHDLDMLTVHGRLSKEGYAAPSNWDAIAECVSLRDKISPSTLIIGNGDIKNSEQGEEYVRKYGVDGYMVGRSILNNPWLFSGRENISKNEMIKTLIKHLDLYEKVWRGSKPLNSQKKYVKAYLSDFDGVNDLRKELLECNTKDEMIAILN